MTSKAEMRSLATKQEGVAEIEDFADFAAFELFDAGQIEIEQSVVGRHTRGSMGIERRGSRIKVRPTNFVTGMIVRATGTCVFL